MTEHVTEETEEETTEGGDHADPEGVDHADPEGVEETEEEPATFPRKVVEDLRKENADYRTKAKRADDLAGRLHTALVTATGRLADPTDLAFAEEHLEDAEALTTAIDELLTRKPHLASRRPSGDVGQGASGTRDTVDLAGMLRSRAG